MIFQKEVEEKRCLIIYVEDVMRHFLEYSKPLTARQHVLKHSIMNLLDVMLELAENGRINEAILLTGKVEDKLISFRKLQFT